jgi:hypothetical protein
VEKTAIPPTVSHTITHRSAIEARGVPEIPFAQKSDLSKNFLN